MKIVIGCLLILGLAFVSECDDSNYCVGNGFCTKTGQLSRYSAAGCGALCKLLKSTISSTVTTTDFDNVFLECSGGGSYCSYDTFWAMFKKNGIPLCEYEFQVLWNLTAGSATEMTKAQYDASVATHLTNYSITAISHQIFMAAWNLMCVIYFDSLLSSCPLSKDFPAIDQV